MKTRRQHIVEVLENRVSTYPTAISQYLDDEDIDVTPNEVVEEIKEIANGHDVLVAPPQCLECHFDDFDRKANIPSRCPECHAERIDEPRFTIDD